MMLYRNRMGLPVALLVITLASSACNGEGSYRQSSKQVRSLVDDVLTATLPGKPFPAKPAINVDPCQDSLGLFQNRVSFAYSYDFTSAPLGENPERLVSIAKDLWRKRGFSIGPEITDGGSIGSFAINDQSINLQVYVNRKDNVAHIGGSGPCVKRPKGMK